MDKNSIKKYAIWARRELIERVSQRALQYGISAEEPGDPNAENINGRMLSQTEKKQRQALISQIREKGYSQVMEEVAYTWFNRFVALRFMEVNGYLPSHIRVFTNDAGEFRPQILAEAIHLELDGLDMDKVYELEQENRTEELYKYLLIVQCNALNSILPGMFQKLEDYTELLHPDYLLREGSVIEQMVTMIPEEDWTDQVQIIGWLYQYYNSELKDQVFADLKKNIKITKEKIPAATQLFTPDWIVHYMVENSLGRLWLEGHPNDELQSQWKYYLDEAEQEPEVQAQLEIIRKEYAALKPEEIRVIDPCMGSGHILCVLFDVLVQIYENYGYTAWEAVVSIIENNLWGLDIDERASQLSYFAVMMKARQYDRRFFSRKVQPHVYAIQESNKIDPQCIDFFVNGREELKSAIDILMAELYDAKEYGSILNVTPVDFDALYARFEEIRAETVPSIYSYPILDQMLPLVQIAQALAQKYHAVVTNPPYMGVINMNEKLVSFIKENYSGFKSDFFSAFIVRCIDMTKSYGFLGFLSPYVWMFILSYEELRKVILNEKALSSLIQFEYSAFEEAIVPICTFSFRNCELNYRGSYIRLTDFKGGMEVQRKKAMEAIKNPNCGYYYESASSNFTFIPGEPLSYWQSDMFFKSFSEKPLGSVVDVRKGLTTADNNRFLRFWWEINVQKSNVFCQLDGVKWFKTHKGGDFRKWYGNTENLINWEDNGAELKAFSGSVIRNPDYYFRECISWNDISSAKAAFRYVPTGSISNASGPSYYGNTDELLYLIGLCNSTVAENYLTVLCPTIHFEIGQITKIPVIAKETDIVRNLVKGCISISKDDWNAFEISWDFQCHPLIDLIPKDGMLFENKNADLAECYMMWEAECKKRFESLKAKEIELNRLFIDIYSLQDELMPEVEDKDVTVRKADLQRDIRSFISYAVGCMFGRYSLKTPGLAYAGGEWDLSKYPADFLPDEDAILPICDDEYFEDDIVGRFVEFVEVVYGKDTLEETLQFIADALGNKGTTSREVIRNYFLSDFYKDHCKIYQKRPIYWLFDSGKKNGFKCLIYLHRYRPDTIARIRTDYVHEQQSRYRTAIEDLERRMEEASSSERVKLKKRLTKVTAQVEELQLYEEKIHHLADQMISIDLDDGVKHNYAIFQDVLAKIR